MLFAATSKLQTLSALGELKHKRALNAQDRAREDNDEGERVMKRRG